MPLLSTKLNILRPGFNVAWLRPPKYSHSIRISLQYRIWGVCGMLVGFLRLLFLCPISEQREWLRSMKLKSENEFRSGLENEFRTRRLQEPTLCPHLTAMPQPWFLHFQDHSKGGGGLQDKAHEPATLRLLCLFDVLCVSLTRTAVVVDVVRQGVHHVLQPLGQDGVGHGFAQREIEDVQVGGQRVLVHAVDNRHLRQYKEQDGAALGRRTVTVAQLVDVYRRLLS